MQTKKIKASVLVVTLMILGIVLVTALSISLVSVKERKASIGSNRSNQAFQTADTGIENVMDAILTTRTDSAKTGNDLGMACSGGILTGTGYTVELKKDETGTGKEITAACSDPLTSIIAIKSVGTGGQSQRAIEAAVAAAGTFGTSFTYGGASEVDCRMNKTNSDTECKYATGADSAWISYTNKPWNTGVSGDYDLSCVQNNNGIFCCRINKGTNNVDCKYSNGWSSAWSSFTYNPWSSGTGTYDLSCGAWYSSGMTCCRTNETTGVSDCKYSPGYTNSWVTFTNKPW